MGNFCDKEYIKLLYLENDDAIIECKLILYKIYYVKNKLFCSNVIKKYILDYFHGEFDNLILKINTEYNKNDVLLNIKDFIKNKIHVHNYYPFKDKNNEYIKNYVKLIDEIAREEKVDTDLFPFYKNIVYEKNNIVSVNINYCHETRKIRLKIDKYNRMLINYISELKNDAIERGIYEKTIS
jgi:hypothetical protein